MNFGLNLLYKFQRMKSIRVLLAAILTTACTTLFAQNTITSSQVDITINGQTTREQLAQLNKDMRAQGLTFTYIPQFDNDRRLLSLQYKLLTADKTVLGVGGHEALQTAGASVNFHLNIETSAFTEIKK